MQDQQKLINIFLKTYEKSIDENVLCLTKSPGNNNQQQNTTHNDFKNLKSQSTPVCKEDMKKQNEVNNENSSNKVKFEKQMSGLQDSNTEEKELTKSSGLKPMSNGKRCQLVSSMFENSSP